MLAALDGFKNIKKQTKDAYKVGLFLWYHINIKDALHKKLIHLWIA